MASKIKKFFKHIFSNRALILLLIFAIMSGVLVTRIFQLQIVNGQEYAENFVMTTTKTRVLESTRGNIYDVKLDECRGFYFYGSLSAEQSV